ncbi:helix-turn-helix domain-containing protein [Paenibacillus sp. USHLN196]|uniref:helix-turn-helix domain-containing protein n=1 Tax=Paenibacillus sp. USHLN196 TaxID=3081291 RepID=UPI0030164BED
MTDIKKKFGENVRLLRINKKLSQEELAFRCGLHRTYVSDVERGTRNISLDNIYKISVALDVPPAELLIL